MYHPLIYLPLTRYTVPDLSAQSAASICEATDGPYSSGTVMKVPGTSLYDLLLDWYSYVPTIPDSRIRGFVMGTLVALYRFVKLKFSNSSIEMNYKIRLNIITHIRYVNVGLS